MIQCSKPNITDLEIKAATDVLRSGRLSDGPKTVEFEAAFAKYVGTTHCVATSNGTFAIESILRALRIGQGDKVLIPTLTFFATVEAVMLVGAKPVFADISEDTWLLDNKFLQDVYKYVHIDCIIPVHIFGNPAIINWTDPDTQLNCIEDCAQAHGAKVYSKSVGTMGDAASWSFYATKNMTTGGEGGCVTTNHKGIDDRVREFRNHGMMDRNTHQFLGTNGRMSEMEAAIGLVQLSRLDEMNSFRKRNSEYVKDKLNKIGWLVPQKIHEGCSSAYFWNAFWVNEDVLGMKTQEFVGIMKEKGVELRHRYDSPLYNQPAYVERFGRVDESLYPNSEKICGKVIGIPNGPELLHKELDYIIDVIKQI